MGLTTSQPALCVVHCPRVELRQLQPLINCPPVHPRRSKKQADLGLIMWLKKKASERNLRCEPLSLSHLSLSLSPLYKQAVKKTFCLSHGPSIKHQPLPPVPPPVNPSNSEQCQTLGRPTTESEYQASKLPFGTQDSLFAGVSVRFGRGFMPQI